MNSIHQFSIQNRFSQRTGRLPITGATFATFAFIAACACANLSAQQAASQPSSPDPVANLYGTLDPEAPFLRFYWETRNWPEWLAGYRLKERTVGTEDWEPIHPEAISPNFSQERDWANQGLNEKDVQTLLEARLNTFAERIPERPPEEVLYLLIKSNGLKSGDRIAQKLDYNVALYSGFGYLHHFDPLTVEPLEKEYGLFTVDKYGDDAATPISTWITTAFSKLNDAPETINLAVKDDIVGLSWTYKEKTAKARGLFGFHVFRQDPETLEWIPLTQTPIGSSSIKYGIGHYAFNDYEGNASSDQRYAVIAADVFQQDFGRLEVTFEALRFKPLSLPAIATHKIVNDADVFIDWEFPEAENKRVHGFYVERGEKGDYERISALIPADSRDFTDKDTKEYGEVYDYRVVAIDQWEKQWTGYKTSLLYLGQAKPPTPKDLRAQFLVKEGQPGVLLEWEGPNSTNRRTAFNRIVNDITEPGNLLVQSYIEPFQGNRFFYPLTINGGRPIQFGVLPVTPEGISGDPAVVEVYMPVLKLPPASGVFAKFDPTDYEAEITWNYPEETDGLTGFRVLINGTPLPDGLEIAPDERSIIINDDRFERGQTFDFSVVALGGLEDSSPSIAAPLWIRTDRLPEEVTPPEGLSVALVDENPESLVAKLSWQPAEDLKEAGLSGYALMVDYAQEGNVRRLNSLPLLLGPEYTYQLPDAADRKAFTFRLAAITLKNEVGPFSETVLQLPERAAEPETNLSQTP